MANNVLDSGKVTQVNLPRQESVKTATWLVLQQGQQEVAVEEGEEEDGDDDGDREKEDNKNNNSTTTTAPPTSKDMGSLNKFTQHVSSRLSFKLVIRSLKAVLNWVRTRVYEQLCLLEIFKLTVSFLIDVFALGERLCSRPMSMHSGARDVSSAGSSAGYGSKRLIG